MNNLGMTNVEIKKYTRKATGFMSLRINCREINQVTSKFQMDFLDKTLV